MDTSHELDSGLTEEPKDTSVDREETRKRTCALKSHSIATLSFGLLCILVISLRFNLEAPCAELLMAELDDLAQRDWLYFHQSLYFNSTTKRNWAASRDYCRQRNADLVVINSREEQEFVSRLKGPSWMGLSQRDTKGTWEWVDGTNMTSSWRRGEPQGGGERCVAAWKGEWSVESCDGPHYWICEKVLEAAHRSQEVTVETPSITAFHSSTPVLPVGQTARFSCSVGGAPEPTVEWLHDGRPLRGGGTDPRSEPAAWVERGFLFVRGLRYGVNTVCCVASNSAGTANHTAELLVFDTCELTLDPNTAHRQLSLSEDNRKVTWVKKLQSYPDHPERFDYWDQLLCRENLTGRCYWEVERKGKVVIGVTYRGITRGQGNDSRLGGNNKSWSLYCDDGVYAVLYNNSETYIPLPPAGSNRVGVYLDRPAGTLSFYRVSPDVGKSSDTLTHIHTFRSTFTQEDLLPGFGLWLDGSSVSLCRL